MTPIDLVEIVRLAKAATPGPWHACDDDGIPVVGPGKPCNGEGSFIASCTEPADVPYIAAASPDVVLRLIAALRRLGNEIEAHNVLVGSGKAMIGPSAVELIARHSITDGGETP